MNKTLNELSIQELAILKHLSESTFINQRLLAEEMDCSVGLINQSIKSLSKQEYIDGDVMLTQKARMLINERKPRNAVILAAGVGMRMVPINLSVSKAFLEVNGERLIERLIKQLHDVGIRNITVVVGFMKENFEYLIDSYGVELVINDKYAEKNNLFSLGKVMNKLSNTYIIPCDIWCKENPFNENETYSWYMVTNEIYKDATVRVNRKKELVCAWNREPGNKMIGIAYILSSDAKILKDNITTLSLAPHNDGLFWEDALIANDRMIVHANVVDEKSVVEINTYEQLRELDSHSDQLKSDAIMTISKALGCSESEISDITVMKKGMTNRSFFFRINNSKYIMRIPGEGTDKLINRNHEAAVYDVISGHSICDNPLYINPDNGYKITKFLENTRVCDSENEEDLKKCMDKLRAFHEKKLQVKHRFDIFEQIDFYESLWEGDPSVYLDYNTTKNNVFSLKGYIDSQKKELCLTHIDAVPDNFLFYKDDNGEEKLQLTDWEYAGMQDPHVDIAMFCIYSLYDKDRCDRLIDLYFKNKCDTPTRIKIYCYIATCGLLWSNWCEYKRRLGIEFGEYSIRQYRYAKDFYRYAKEMMENNK